jgi:acyl phosphate:glycerol-3-phosphate acyltransferase
MLASVLAVVAAYLVGSLSFAVIVSRVAGLSDPRTYGSKNPGATNVLRSGSRGAAITTLVLDAAKGYVPVALAAWLAPRFGFGEGTIALVGLAAFVGHLWPVFFGFHGGKGVATAAGVLMGLNVWLGLATLASFAIIVFFFRYVSLASIIAAAFAPFYQMLIWGTGPTLFAIGVMGLLLTWRHAANLQRLFAGTEAKLGSKGKAAAASAHPMHPPHPRRHKKGH